MKRILQDHEMDEAYYNEITIEELGAHASRLPGRAEWHD